MWATARADVAEDEVLDAALDALQALSDLARDRHDEIGLATDDRLKGLPGDLPGPRLAHRLREALPWVVAEPRQLPEDFAWGDVAEGRLRARCREPEDAHQAVFEQVHGMGVGLRGENHLAGPVVVGARGLPECLPLLG
jgi:hypothetical protein